MSALRLAASLYGTFLAAYVVASLVTLAYDLLVPADRMGRYKTKATRRAEVLETYWRALPLTAANVLITVPVAVLVLVPFIRISGPFGARELWKLPLLYLLTDLFFFASHRALHFEGLFRRFHRIHHRFTRPVGLAALYAHPVEVVLGNVLSVILPPMVVGASLPLYQLWIVLSIFNTVVMSHGGIRRLSWYHDLHHQRYDVNFGAEIGVMDRLFGTYSRSAGSG